MDGVKIRAEDNRADKPYRLFRVAVILLAALVLLGGGGAWAAQRFGAPWDLVLGPIGRRYTATLHSGNYTAGEDLPAGQYTLRALRGAGDITTPRSGRQTVDAADSKGQAYIVELAEGDTLALAGLTVAAQCESTRSDVRTPEKDPQLDFDSLLLQAAAETPAEYVAGWDFPPGRYAIRVASGRGTVTAGTSLSLLLDDGIRDGDGQPAETAADGAVRGFRRVRLEKGATITLDGVDIRLIPD